MSQHDFNIANQTFPSFRSDLNDALQAAATISAGATAPTTPYAYQLWYDTANEKYMIRNAANSAWLNFVGIDTNGNVNVTGTVTADDIAISDSTPTFTMTDTDTNALFRVSASSAVGSVTLEVDENGVGSNPQFLIQGQNVDRFRIDGDSGDISFYEDTGTSAKFFWDASTQQLGLGTSSPDYNLQIEDDTSSVNLSLRSGTASNSRIYFGDSGSAVIGQIVYRNGNDSMAFETNGSEAARIDSSGNVLVGGTSLGENGAVTMAGDGRIYAIRASDTAGFFGRTSTNGSIVNFTKDGNTVGSIGTNGGSRLFISTGDTGLDFEESTDAIRPCSGAGGGRDNAIDLGRPDVRFDDIYATNGTIQTSDQNEKQQIAALTDAEITAAKAISQLFKTFKWNSAVTEKGDAARTHAGVIAQDVQAAMTAAGLDAGDYAFFISSTWWETQTDVPAVEAVDAVLDEDGNVVTEAVEAVAAYTRTDTYDTAEEAPEGATERTRRGIRYPELLAFVGAATEQRLGNIETRLAALEAN